MSNINIDIQEAIKKNLSGQVAGELSRVLEEYDSLKRKLPIANDKATHFEKETLNLKLNYDNLKHDYDELVKEVGDLNEREMVISRVENNLEIDKMKLQLIMTEKSKVEMLSLVDKVFGHPSVTISNTKTMNHSVPVEGGGDNLGNKFSGTTMLCNDSENSTTTTTEGKE